MGFVLVNYKKKVTAEILKQLLPSCKLKVESRV